MNKYVWLGLAIAVAACSKSESTSGAADTNSAAQLQKTSLTAADLDGFQKGITEEIRLVREGQAQAAAASSAGDRGNAIQSTFEENTVKGAVPVSGLSFERYHLVRDVLSRLLTTLDYQDKIPGPQSVDTALADSTMKARLHSDPYSELDASSAALVQSRLNTLAPLWIQYEKLTITGG